MFWVLLLGFLRFTVVVDPPASPEVREKAKSDHSVTWLLDDPSDTSDGTALPVSKFRVQYIPRDDVNESLPVDWEQMAENKEFNRSKYKSLFTWHEVDKSFLERSGLILRYIGFTDSFKNNIFFNENLLRNQKCLEKYIDRKTLSLRVYPFSPGCHIFKGVFYIETLLLRDL